MRLIKAVVFAALAGAVSGEATKRSWHTHDHYVVEHDPLSGVTLAEAANALGVEVIERAGELKDHWVVRALKAESVDTVLATRESLHAWKAGGRAADNHDARHYTERVASGITYVEKQVLRQRSKRQGPPSDTPAQPDAPPRPVVPAQPDAPVRPITPARPDVPSWKGNETGVPSHDVALHLDLLDPEFGKQWHLVNDENPDRTMNVSGLWEMGITGRGVISALIDDGLDYTSDDLSANFYALGSYDYNDHVDLPTPVLPEDTHGTRCAGQIAAAKNDVCGVGIAYDSRVAGIRILSGPISDIDEAASLNYAYQNTSIYSCSWGPTDDGQTMEAPGYLVEKAFVEGINNGRGGKGSIYVFASGNGAWSGDQCNFDGFTNSIYSITVAALDHKNLHPSYSEACAANMVVAYSSGSGKSIATTDVARDGSGSKCTTSHGGTSAAAPNAVGVIALALSVRPDLTWRDTQHLAVRTAVQISPDDPDWEPTAQGRPFSYKYGFGLLDGYRYVTAAKEWKNVKPQSWLDLPYVQLNNGTMDLENKMSGGEQITKEGVMSSVAVTQDMLTSANFESLEHVTIRVWIKHARRGNVEVEVVSPNGIKSILAAERRNDGADTGFPGWRFSSLKHWDENPRGNWTIRVNDQGNEHTGAFLGWTMSLWGSTIDASKAQQWSVPKLATVFPPLHPDEAENHPAASSSIADAATSTKNYNSPTAVLGDNHTHAEGEAERPAFASSSLPSPTSSSNATGASGADWLSDTKDFVSDQRYLVGAVGILILVVVVGGILLQRQLAARRRRAQYASLAHDENMPLRSLDSRLRSAPGGALSSEPLDDEDEANEETKLHHSQRELGFHSGFLDDEESSPARVAPPSVYKDEPGSEHYVENGGDRA